MPAFFNSLLDAANIAIICIMMTAELIITLTIAARTDNLLGRELVKVKIKDLGTLRDEINTFKSEGNTAKRLAPFPEMKVYAAENRQPHRTKDKKPAEG